MDYFTVGDRIAIHGTIDRLVEHTHHGLPREIAHIRVIDGIPSKHQGYIRLFTDTLAMAEVVLLKRPKTPGQRAYEAFPAKHLVRPWGELCREDQENWEAAAKAARDDDDG